MEVKYLGYIFSNKGIQPDIEKIKAISKLKSPANKTELELLLGMITYVNRFITNVSQLNSVLRNLGKKDSVCKCREKL